HKELTNCGGSVDNSKYDIRHTCTYALPGEERTMMRLRTMFVLCGVATAILCAQSGNDLFQKGLTKERADGNLRGAIQLYQQVVSMRGADRTLAAEALFRLA